MSNVSKIGLTILGIAATIGVYRVTDNYITEMRKEKAEFRKAETELVTSITETSPLASNAIKINIPRHVRQREWYHMHPYAPVDGKNIIFVENNSIYLATREKKSLDNKLADNVNLAHNHLFSVAVRDTASPDVYWIDKDLNLHELENNKGVYSDKGTIVSLKKYFNNLPRNIDLGDVNVDKKVDIVYAGNTEIRGKNRNVLRALIEKSDTKDADLEDKMIAYLGKDQPEAIKFDKEGDIIFKVLGNKKEIFGLENKLSTSIFKMKYKLANANESLRSFETEFKTRFEEARKPSSDDDTFLDWYIMTSLTDNSSSSIFGSNYSGSLFEDESEYRSDPMTFEDETNTPTFDENGSYETNFGEEGSQDIDIDPGGNYGSDDNSTIDPGDSGSDSGGGDSGDGGSIDPD